MAAVRKNFFIKLFSCRADAKLPRMKTTPLSYPRPVRRCKPKFTPRAAALLCSVAVAADISAQTARAAWEKTADTLAWKAGNETLWQFSWSTNQTKPFFHPIRLVGGESLTTLSPPDHLHHYGLWFSWKYINEVNYWELDKKTGRSVGPTLWDVPEIATHDDGSVGIKMNLRYVSPSNQAVVLIAEQREINVSAPKADGSVSMDWTCKFTAGDIEILLDRTHMPGEPHGAVNGGYAGFSMRVAQDPAKVDFLTIEGPVEKFESDRARPNTKAAAANMTKDGRTDGVAILSHASNVGGDSPWYMINSKTMRWFSPALIAPAAKKVAPRESFTWKFRVITKAGAWKSDDLKTASDEFNR
jgi:hypothetical protein